jgi:hypothetical protein
MADSSSDAGSAGAASPAATEATPGVTPVDLEGATSKKYIKDNFVSTFNGWHLSTSNALHQSTLAAYAVGNMKNRILQPAKIQDRVWHHTMPCKLGLDKMYLLLLRPNGAVVASNTDRRYAFWKPMVVIIKGPRVNAVPTYCKVKNHYLKRSLYTIILVKVDAYAENMYREHKEEENLREGRDLKSYDRYIPLEKRVEAFGDKANDAKVTEGAADNKEKSLQISNTAANLLLAMRVRHMCDNDAGAEFRDKRGREGAIAELDRACHAYLRAAFDIQ